MTREGGFSTGEYRGLNLGMGSGDDPLRIHANMERLARAFSLTRGVATVRQVHGNQVVVLDERRDSGEEVPEADAIVTAMPGLAVGILTADCVPLLVHDPARGLVAAIHAGWRGLLAGVIETTLAAMAGIFGSRNADLLVAMGPHIGPCCYEVRKDLLQVFEARRDWRGDLFREERDSLYLDLGRAVTETLLGLGIRAGQINGPGPCTSCHEARFFSYRRDGTTGRQLSFIVMN